MVRLTKPKSNTRIIFSDRETTVLCAEGIELKVYPHCVLPEHYFELALSKLERRKAANLVQSGQLAVRSNRSNSVSH